MNPALRLGRGPAAEGEGGVEQGDVGEACFAQEVGVFFGGKGGQFGGEAGDDGGGFVGG